MFINDLLDAYRTDKVEYAVLYHALFNDRRHEIQRVMEVGIGTMDPDAHSSMVGWAREDYRPGASLRAWRDFFPKARVFGLDTAPDTQFSEDRIQTFLCDSTDSDSVNKCIEEIGFSEFDLIIDDGSHVPTDQLATLANLLPHVRTGGVYILEDIVRGSPLTHKPELLEAACGSNAYFHVGLNRNIVVICKRSDNASPLYAHRL